MNRKQILLGALLAGTAGTPLAIAASDKPSAGGFPPLGGATAWLNSPPLTVAGLRGSVVLVDFWTYSCINWRRTLPYVRAWAAKYRSHGLVVIGVHTPEFPFEQNIAGVRHAIQTMQVDYPVAVDNDYAVWNAFNNEYWPALYFIDAQGTIRHHEFGEGNYKQSEVVIQRLLTEAGHSGFDRTPVTVDPHGLEVAADWNDLQTPETYVGYARSENFVSPHGGASDKPYVYSAPAHLALNDWALTGDWTIRQRSGVSNAPNGRIAFQFHARDLHLVMGPAAPATPVRFRIRIDGQPPGAAHGTDSDAQGTGIVAEQRLYQLVRQPRPITDRRFEIEFLDAGAEAFSFTFG